MIASPTYRLVERTMEDRRLVVCHYQGLRRELCPVVLGWSDGPLTTPETRWRCMNLDEVTDAVVQDGWPDMDARHRAAQSCVTEVDLDINPLSPLGPRRRLAWQR